MSRLQFKGLHYVGIFLTPARRAARRKEVSPTRCRMLGRATGSRSRATIALNLQTICCRMPSREDSLLVGAFFALRRISKLCRLRRKLRKHLCSFASQSCSASLLQQHHRQDDLTGERRTHDCRSSSLPHPLDPRRVGDSSNANERDTLPRPVLRLAEGARQIGRAHV